MCVQGGNYLFSICICCSGNNGPYYYIIQSFIQLSGPTPAAYYYYKGYGPLLLYGPPSTNLIILALNGIWSSHGALQFGWGPTIRLGPCLLSGVRASFCVPPSPNKAEEPF